MYKENIAISLINSMLETIRISVQKNANNSAYLISAIDFPNIGIIEAPSIYDGIDILKRLLTNAY